MKARLSGYGKYSRLIEVMRVFQKDGWNLLLAVTKESYN
jgi:hypothetical protein